MPAQSPAPREEPRPLRTECPGSAALVAARDALAPARPSRLPSLDGWRAISIILVLGSHCEVTPRFPPPLAPFFDKLFDGNMGVRFFFTISGFLITWLLVLEHDQHGQINLKHFYIRRALRILPVYLAFLLTLAALQLFTPFTQSIQGWIGNLTFTTNFIRKSPWTSGHLWSLAIEEQFYLVWPGIFLLLTSGTAAYPRRALAVLAMPTLLAPISRVMTYLVFKSHALALSLLFPSSSFFNYCDCLAAGCVCALFLAHWRETVCRWLANSRIAATVAVMLILTRYIFNDMFHVGIIDVPLRSTMQTWGFAILLLQSVLSPNWGLYRVLNWPWICRIGVLSYSIYIWQMVFCTNPKTFGLGPVWWMSFPGWLIPVFAVSAISYYGLERPLLRLRALFKEVK
ncbi:MAG: acyltransferase [Verrucomicrobia bacterium]|nr:acyltransferase [Verrucomicrobiota bacterium]